MTNRMKFKDLDEIIRKVVQGYHNIYTSPPEYTINFALRHRLWRSFSLVGQKFSKQTLPLVRDVNSLASQQSSEQPPKQRSPFISEVNSSLHEAHHRKVKNSFNIVNHLTGGLVPPSKQGLALDLQGQLSLHFPGPGLIRKKRPVFSLFFLQRQSLVSDQSGRSYICDQTVQTVRLAAAWV